MRYSFAKYHGLGNDFILLDGLSRSLPAMERQTVMAWCDRHLGIGADGVIVVRPSRRAACRMQIFNADGTEAPMCGNGLRCLAMFVWDEALLSETHYTVETLAGLLPVKLERDALGQVTGVTVHMGQPRLSAGEVPMVLTPDDQSLGRLTRPVQVPVAVNGRIWEVTAVNTGAPQCVVFVPDVDALDICTLGPALEHHPAFPQGVNVMLTQVIHRSQVRVRPWERGVGATLACGTGACAVVVAGVLTGQTERQVQVLLPGGALHIQWEEDTGQMVMTGPATRVFTGQWHKAEPVSRLRSRPVRDRQ